MPIFHRVTGPPGTGKTTYLSHQIERAREKYEDKQILVTSFTKAAAKEISSRIKIRDEDRIGTLHAICWRLVGRPTIAETKIGQWNDYIKEENPMFKLSGGDSDMDEPPDWNPNHERDSGDDLYNRIKLNRAKCLSIEFWKRLEVAFRKQWELWKKDNGYMDFTDLIEKCAHGYLGPPGGVRLIFVDEAQDLSALEMRLIRQWTNSVEQCVIAGDSWQCLYTFKGSDPHVFMDVAEGGEGVSRVLKQSYRVPRRVHATAMKLSEQLKVREDITYLPRDFEGEVELRDYSYKNAPQIIKVVEKDLSIGKTVMILTTCGYQLNDVLKYLRQKGIAFHNPYRKKNGSWNPIRYDSKLKTAGSRLMAFAGSEEKNWAWRNKDLALWSEHLRADIFRDRGMKKKIKELAKDKPDEPIWEYEFFKEEDVEEHILRRDIIWFEDHLLDTKKASYKFPLAIYRKYGVAGLRQKPRLIVGTIHSVKGGEADTVVVFPDLSPAASVHMYSGDEGWDSIIRLFYVAFTRAREKLILGYPATRNRIAFRPLVHG